MISTVRAMNETNELRWKCRRGMRELDLMLLYYLEHDYPGADEEAKQAFEKILDMQDPELYFLILGKSEIDDPAIIDVIEALRNARRF